MMKVKLHKITFNEILDCFIPEYKYRYLGYVLNPYLKGTKQHAIIEDFIRYVDRIVKPCYLPRFILRLTHLFGNDNSIVRVRNRYIHNLHKKLTKGIMITDIKTKWDDYDIRIYGFFPDFIQDKISEVEDKIYALKNENVR